MDEEPKRTIVVVDDEVMIGEMLEEFLKKWGYCVHVFENAKEALVAITSEIGYVDVVLSDINMSVMDGLELARTVKSLFPWTKVVLVSGNIKESFAGKLSDCDVFLGKPIALFELKKVLEALFTKIE